MPLLKSSLFFVSLLVGMVSGAIKAPFDIVHASTSTEGNTAIFT